LARVDRRNTTRYWNDPHLAGLSCLCADFTAHDYAPHSHEALVVAVTEAGGSEFRSRGEVNEASTSALLVFNPTEPHSGRMARSARWRYRGLYLTETALESLTETLGIDTVPYFTANVFRDIDLIEAFLDLHRALQKGTDALLACEHLVGSLGQLFRSKAAQKNQTELVVMITPEILPNNSPGVTNTLPRMTEKFLEPLDPKKAIPAPAPAFRPQADAAPGASPVAAPAQIVSASGCRWQDSAPRADLGGNLAAGTSRLAEGIVEFEFDGRRPDWDVPPQLPHSSTAPSSAFEMMKRTRVQGDC